MEHQAAPTWFPPASSQLFRRRAMLGRKNRGVNAPANSTRATSVKTLLRKAGEGNGTTSCWSGVSRA